jgi:hypothetical protein
VPGALSFRLRRHSKQGAHGRKNPLPVTQHPEGVSATRRLDTNPHGALRSKEAYPLQCSSLQGLLPHRSSDQEALGLHPQLYIFLYVTQLLDCQEQLGRFSSFLLFIDTYSR